ncbi:MAG: hypothetical protein WCK51_05905 [Armatimonadota bacterium]
MEAFKFVIIRNAPSFFSQIPKLIRLSLADKDKLYFWLILNNGGKPLKNPFFK